MMIQAHTLTHTNTQILAQTHMHIRTRKIRTCEQKLMLKYMYIKFKFPYIFVQWTYRHVHTMYNIYGVPSTRSQIAIVEW